MKLLMTLAAVIPLALLSACEPEESRPIPTKEMLPQFEVRTDENGDSKISMVLVRDLFSSIDLVGGDQMVITGGGARAVVVGTNTVLKTGNAENTEFQFDFQRPDQVDAPNSKGTLPPPMTLTAPAANSVYTAQDDSILVRWTDTLSTDSMAVGVSVSCRTFTGVKPLDTSAGAVINADLGITSYSLSELADRLDRNCSVYDGVLTLSRSREGTLDGAYGPSDDCKRTQNCFGPAYYFVLRQVRSVPVVINNRPT